MARKVFQNGDLLRLIYGFGDNHRDSMVRIRKEIKSAFLSKVPQQYPYTRPDYHLMNGKNMKDTLELFFQLRRCMCCTRHAHNKPQLGLVQRFDNTWIAIDKRHFQVPECTNFHDCDCSCRHEMRQIARRISYRSALNTIKYG